MNNGKQISFSLCGAITLSLCASVHAEEVSTHSLDVSDKILLMETINVTSNKEITDEDLTSSDPEVDRVLKLVDGVAMSPEDPTDQPVNEDTEKTIDADSVDLKSTETDIKIKKTAKDKAKLSDSVSKPNDSRAKDSERTLDPKTDKSK